MRRLRNNYVHYMHICLITPVRRIRYNGCMSWWDEDWLLYAAAVALPIVIAIGLWLFGVWFGG
jgi:hypothetical protein